MVPPKTLTLQTLLNLISYRVARSRTELEQSYHLIYDEYIKRGYMQENPSHLRISFFNALPETTTFIAIAEETIIATVTLIPDSPLGLPMDEIYHKELDTFRGQKKKICEISMLASNTEFYKNGISLMLNSKKMFFIFYLFKLVYDYAKDYLNLDYLCITINPKHKLTYDFLLFKDFGELKTYSGANGAPAIGKYADVKNIRDECRREKNEGLERMFFSRETDPIQFSNKVMLREEDLEYFFMRKTDVFKNASPTQLAYLKNCYPNFDFSKLK
ncbi:MAG: hypothetical protein JXD21_03030 [Candidatus Omnitrophica bacterium]|nr:hypothetical protein [Candidatus Omnitrophota bacterium]